MIKKNLGYFCYILFVLTITGSYGCKHRLGEGRGEGKIVYEVSYPDTLKNGPMAAFLPKEMTLYFKDNITNAEFKMGMGLITTRFLSDAGKGQFSTIFKGFGKKSAMTFNREQVKTNFLDHVDLKLVETGKTIEIAGYQCKEVTVTDSTDNTYEVYYTEEVDLDDPNWCTPFNEIDGLMLQYSIKVNNMVMNLKAKSVVFEKVDSLNFVLPADYEIITDPKQFKPF